MYMHDLSIAVFSFSGHQHLLPYCLRSIYKNAPACREIILVWDDYIDWYPIDFDRLRRATKVDFRLVPQSSISEWPDSIIRWGWIKQQLAKLHCTEYSTTQNTWIVDGDVLITGDPELFVDHDPVLRYDADLVVPPCYKPFMQRYLGIDDFNANTYVGSTGLFDHDICRVLESLCRSRSGMNLVAAVDHMITSGSHADLPFSEFECYGHVARHSSRCKIKSHNWNYVESKQPDWSLPIQIAWAQEGDNLDIRYKNLMRHTHPETVDH